MRRSLHIAALAALLIIPMAVLVMAVGDRAGGNTEFVYESVNGAGISFATNAADTIKLGMSIGQSGIIVLGTNTDTEAQNGFWKAEGSCVLYRPTIIDEQNGTNAIGITFTVVNSNTYDVLYISHEGGGPEAGMHAYTNWVTTLIGKGAAGSSTTIWHDVSSSTNIGQFYLIRCQE